MKSFILILQILILKLSKIKTQEENESKDYYCQNALIFKDCEKYNSMKDITKSRTLYTRPIFSSRCCWDEKSNKCIYKDGKTDYDPFVWFGNINCFTGIEKCYYKGDVGYKDYMSCYSIPTEQPYSCCYIGNRRKSQCFPINVLKKSIFKKTLHHLRTYYGDFNGEFEVICSGYFIKGFLWIFIFFFLGII